MKRVILRLCSAGGIRLLFRNSLIAVEFGGSMTRSCSSMAAQKKAVPPDARGRILSVGLPLEGGCA